MCSSDTERIRIINNNNNNNKYTYRVLTLQHK